MRVPIIPAIRTLLKNPSPRSGGGAINSIHPTFLKIRMSVAVIAKFMSMRSDLFIL